MSDALEKLKGIDKAISDLLLARNEVEEAIKVAKTANLPASG